MRSFRTMRYLSRRNACQIYSRWNVFFRSSTPLDMLMWMASHDWSQHNPHHCYDSNLQRRHLATNPLAIEDRLRFCDRQLYCQLIVNYTTITFYWVNTPWRKYEGGFRACNKKRTKVYTYFIRCPTFGSKSGIGNPDKLPVAQVRLLCQECSQDTLTKYSGIFDIHELFTLALLEGNSKIGSWMILFG